MAGATTMFSNGSVPNQIKEFVVDTDDQLSTIDISQILPGSRAFVINTSQWYMLNHQGQWQTIDWGGGGGGSEYDHIIYNGGEP